VERRGIELLVVLDTSLSMEANDVVPNRLERSKQEIRELMDGLRGNRVGIVLFAGSSFLLCPLTLDVAAANLFLDAVDVDVLPDPGTNLEEALRGAARAFAGQAEATGARAVILFTDGESHLGEPLPAARELEGSGIPVFTVGVGTPSGQPIPILDETGRLTGYKKDRSGEVVLSRLDEGILRRIAETTGGSYFPATLSGREVGAILDELDKLRKGELGGTLRRRVEERFQVPLGIAVVLLVLSLLVPEAERRRGDLGALAPGEESAG
jgi:Ca-activated chloride channel family protein